MFASNAVRARAQCKTTRKHPSGGACFRKCVNKCIESTYTHFRVHLHKYVYIYYIPFSVKHCFCASPKYYAFTELGTKGTCSNTLKYSRTHRALCVFVVLACCRAQMRTSRHLRNDRHSRIATTPPNVYAKYAAANTITPLSPVRSMLWHTVQMCTTNAKYVRCTAQHTRISPERIVALENIFRASDATRYHTTQPLHIRHHLCICYIWNMELRM